MSSKVLNFHIKLGIQKKYVPIYTTIYLSGKIFTSGKIIYFCR